MIVSVSILRQFLILSSETSEHSKWHRFENNLYALSALKANIKPEKIVFSGVGKTYEELKFAISKKILLINTESENEIIEIEKIAKKNNKKINIGLRFNPDTDAETLKKISTGKKENKFGLTNLKFLDLLNKYKNSRFINIICFTLI